MTLKLPDPWYEVRRSSIHNEGVFAARDIPKGTRIIEYMGEKVTKAESTRRATAWFEKASRSGDGAVYVFILNSRYDIDGNVPWNTARLINHSCAPNCDAEIFQGRIWVVSRRRIPAGTELTFNYGFDLESWEDHPCRCGAPTCVGYIAGREYWPKLRRLLKERQQSPAARARMDLPAVKTKRPPRKSKAAKRPAGKTESAPSATAPRKARQ